MSELQAGRSTRIASIDHVRVFAGVKTRRTDTWLRYL